MKIGIDISQFAYPNTGVANYLSHLLDRMTKDSSHEFILFFSSLRRDLPLELKDVISRSNVKIVRVRFPLGFLNFLWNKLHIFPIENLIGKVDIFLTSDWLEPPARNAKKATIIYDLIVYKHPNETDRKIVDVQKRKLSWVRKESDAVFCISESTKNDVREILGLDSSKVKVIYPGFI